MAQIHGEPGKEVGDKRVYEVLKTLPTDWVVYAQATLVHKRERRSADYVLINRDLGLVILEVKDWVRIEDRTADMACVYRSDKRRSEWTKSPHKQAEEIAWVAKDILMENPELSTYAGKLPFPYRCAGILPHQKGQTIKWLEGRWGEGRVMGDADLTREGILKALKRIPAPFDRPMTPSQFDAARAMLDERLIVRDHATGAFKGIYSQLQEEIAKEALVVLAEAPAQPEPEQQKGFLSSLFPGSKERLSHLEREVPEEVKNLRAAANVRLVRGYAGTGKTDILVLRAAYLHDKYPEMDFLVTTFNRPVLDERLIPELKALNRVDVRSFSELSESLYRKKHGRSVSPQATIGVVRRLVESNDSVASIIKTYGADFICDEIQWIKEMGYTKRDMYLSNHRDGRGKVSGKSLSARMKAEIFDVFERYEQELKEIVAIDWTDLHEMAYRFTYNGTKPEKLYDVVFIDEAQHFAPSWIKAMTKFLKEGGSLFICDDPSQSVYRIYSWKEKGVDVTGRRTRWLRIPYRCTRQIFDAAFTLIESNPLSQQMLAESGTIEKPDLTDPRLRQGEPPAYHQINSLAEELEFVRQKCDELVTGGFLPGEIAVLHTKKHVIDKFRGHLPSGIKVDELTRRTGMEYKAVFVPRVQHLFERDIDVSWERDFARNQLAYYTAFTRARDFVYLSGNDKFPKELEPIVSKMKVHLPQENSASR